MCAHVQLMDRAPLPSSTRSTTVPSFLSSKPRELVTLLACLLVLGCESAPSAQPAPQATPTPPTATQPTPPTTDAAPAASTTSPETAPAAAVAEEREPVPAPAPIDQAKLREDYEWLTIQRDLPELTTVERAFPAPTGFEREEVSAGSYAAYLRGLPVRTDRTNVLLYTGEPVSMPSAGVIPLDLGKRDVHQCADSVIRLFAEYLWSIDKAQLAEFHYTSGDLSSWKRWRKGKLLAIKKGKVVEVSGKPYPNTHKGFRRWQEKVFMYASTRSMHRDSKRIEAPGELAPGDFFLKSATPGHVVILLDIARDKDGRRAALIGQGYLPAREFHVISGSGDRVLDGAWYLLPESDADKISTPTWSPFSMEHAWRFKAADDLRE